MRTNIALVKSNILYHYRDKTTRIFYLSTCIACIITSLLFGWFLPCILGIIAYVFGYASIRLILTFGETKNELESQIFEYRTYSTKGHFFYFSFNNLNNIRITEYKGESLNGVCLGSWKIKLKTK